MIASVIAGTSSRLPSQNPRLTIVTASRIRHVDPRRSARLQI